MFSRLNQSVLRSGLWMLLVIASIPAFAGQKVMDTIAERLLSQGKYRIVSDRIGRLLKEGGGNTGNDLSLYYYTMLSMAQLRLNNFDSAKICARQALKLSATSKDSALISDSWKMMAFACNSSGALDSAALFTRKLLNYSGRSGDKRQYRSALNSMATILIQSKRPAEALPFYREATVITEQLGDTANFVRSYYNLGGCLLTLKRYDTAQVILDKAENLAEQRKQPELLMLILGERSECFIAMGRKEEWKKYQLKAYKIARQLGNNLFMALCNSSLAQAALADNDLKSALEYGARADSLLRIEPYPDVQKRVDSTMYLSCKKLGNFEASLSWHESFVRRKEQMMNDNQASQLNQMMVEYRVKEKNLTIEKQELDIRSKKRQLQLLVLLLVITTLYIIGQISYSLSKRKFREALYRKEKYLDQQINEMKHYKDALLKGKDGLSEQDAMEHRVAHGDEPAIVNSELFDGLYLRIMDVLSKQKLYLDPELSMKTLINQLGTNKTYLYQAINRNSSENFRGLINRYRVNEAKRIIEEGVAASSVFDTTEVYLKSGFNSAASYFRAFKLTTGLTPKEYANEFRKHSRKQLPDNSETSETGNDNM